MEPRQQQDVQRALWERFYDQTLAVWAKSFPSYMKTRLKTRDLRQDVLQYLPAIYPALGAARPASAPRSPSDA